MPGVHGPLALMNMDAQFSSLSEPVVLARTWAKTKGERTFIAKRCRLRFAVVSQLQAFEPIGRLRTHTKLA
jgi:hypothetical protein